MCIYIYIYIYIYVYIYTHIYIYIYIYWFVLFLWSVIDKTPIHVIFVSPRPAPGRLVSFVMSCCLSDVFVVCKFRMPLASSYRSMRQIARCSST